MPDSFFTTDNEWFLPTSHTRGPWSEDHCHAGPPTGLIARALEHTLVDHRLTRLTVNLIRPIPFAGFRIETSITRRGRIVALAEAKLIDQHETICATASSLHMAPQPQQSLPTHTPAPLNPDDAIVGDFPIRRTLHDLPSFRGDGVSVKYPPGHNPEPGPTIAWLRTVPLLADETPSAFQKICPLADCGNAFGRNAEPSEYNFMNPDLTLLLHRDPIGEWLGTNAVSHWQPDGIGMADAELFDRKGCVGRALQTLLIRPAGA
jgi:hypothetical protein